MRLERQRECEWLCWLGRVSADWAATYCKTAWTSLRTACTPGAWLHCPEVSDPTTVGFHKASNAAAAPVVEVWCLQNQTTCFCCTVIFTFVSARSLKIAFARKVWSSETENCIYECRLKCTHIWKMFIKHLCLSLKLEKHV